MNTVTESVLPVHTVALLTGEGHREGVQCSFASTGDLDPRGAVTYLQRIKVTP